MSYIDTINHSHVGNFAGLPVYHPLENLDEDKKYEFSATPNNLIIGGGSGEHAGMVVKNLDACVWEFLKIMVTIANKDSDEIEFFNTWEESLGDKFYDEYNPKNNLEFNHWSIDDIKSFALKVEDIYEKSTKYYSNKKELRNLNAEEKINVMLGEFLYFSGQKLLSPEMREYIKDLPEIFEKHDLYVDCAFSALIVPPKGYPVSGRQIVRHDTEPKGRFQWELRFDEEELIDPILNSPNRHKKEIKTKLKM